jgi:hypothetical protein
MKPINILHFIRRFAVLAGLVLAFTACQKEFSVENGGYGGTAEGELIDSLGYCKNIVVQGNYIVDTPLNSSNYVTVNLNFTSAGKYKVYSDTVNGIWFIDSGFVVSAGQTAIKLKGKGTPSLAKQSDFAIYFGNNLCNFTVTTTGTGGSSGGGGGTTGNQDYFPLTFGSSWVYQYLPPIGTLDTFTVRIAPDLVQVPGETLLYYQFGTPRQDTFYFAKSNSGDYYALSTLDFDYTLLFESFPNFISYIFLKPGAAVTDSWTTAEWGKVKVRVSQTATEEGYAKAIFTIVGKDITHTVHGKQYTNVINVKREIQFKPDGGSYRTLIIGNSYYAKGYGLIDQVLGSGAGAQNVPLYKLPDIK